MPLLAPAPAPAPAPAAGATTAATVAAATRAARSTRRGWDGPPGRSVTMCEEAARSLRGARTPAGLGCDTGLQVGPTTNI